MSSDQKLKQIIEAALLAAGRPLSLDELLALFAGSEQQERKAVREALDELSADYEGRGIEVREVGSGFRIQVRSEFAPWISRLWSERPPRYSRALMETLALIVYRQPITRGEIEEIRGVSVSSNIIRTLMEREWVRVVGQRDVPGRPSLYASTKKFLDYFGLKSLSDLPTLAEIRDLDSINQELDLEIPGIPVDDGDVVSTIPDEEGVEEPTEAEAGEAEKMPEAIAVEEMGSDGEESPSHG